MSDNTKIEWTDATVNAVNGCSVVSPGCTNCYAMKLAGTRLKHSESRAGLTVDTKAGPVWNGITRLNEKALLQPLHWRAPRDIFWNAHGDLFHATVPDVWIDRVFAVCALTPQHRHQILTKRPERMCQFLTDPIRAACIAYEANRISHARGTLTKDVVISKGLLPLPNVWLGTSVEDQMRADERIPHLLATPAAVRFLSCEPLLGPINLTNITGAEKSREYGSPVHGWSAIWRNNTIGRAWIDWIIVGGESGPGSRPMHPDWARSLRDQCAGSGVPFFFKQWGEWAPAGEWYADHRVSLPLRGLGPNGWTDDGVVCARDPDYVVRVGKKAAGRLLDAVVHSGMPA